MSHADGGALAVVVCLMVDGGRVGVELFPTPHGERLFHLAAAAAPAPASAAGGSSCWPALGERATLAGRPAPAWGGWGVPRKAPQADGALPEVGGTVVDVEAWPTAAAAVAGTASSPAAAAPSVAAAACPATPPTAAAAMPVATPSTPPFVLAREGSPDAAAADKGKGKSKAAEDDHAPGVRCDGNASDDGWLPFDYGEELQTPPPAADPLCGWGADDAMFAHSDDDEWAVDMDARPDAAADAEAEMHGGSSPLSVSPSSEYAPAEDALVGKGKAPLPEGPPEAPEEEDDAVLCAVCLDEVPYEELSLVKGCMHAYCIGCILDWARFKAGDNNDAQVPCPTCKVPFEYMLTRRALDGSVGDELGEEPVTLLLRASWFVRGKQALRGAEDHCASPNTSFDDHDDECQWDLDCDYDDDCGYRASHKVRNQITLGNRRFGAGGYVQAGRMSAVPRRGRNGAGGSGSSGAASSAHARSPKYSGGKLSKSPALGAGYLGTSPNAAGGWGRRNSGPSDKVGGARTCALAASAWRRPRALAWTPVRARPLTRLTRCHHVPHTARAGLRRVAAAARAHAGQQRQARPARAPQTEPRQGRPASPAARGDGRVRVRAATRWLKNRTDANPARRGWGNGVVRELRQQCSKSRQAARSGTHASAGAHVLIKHTSDVNETVLLVTPARGVQPPASWRLSRTHYCSSS